MFSQLAMFDDDRANSLLEKAKRLAVTEDQLQVIESYVFPIIARIGNKTPFAARSISDQ